MNNFVFSYSNRNTFFHKINPTVKLFLLPVLSFLTFFLPFDFCLSLFFVQLILVMILRFSAREILTDLAPIIFYIFLVYFANFWGIFFVLIKELPFCESMIQSCKNAFWDKNTFISLFRIFVLVQTSSIFFKTTSSVKIKASVESIELFISKIFGAKDECLFSDCISLFITFIPRTFELWNQLVLSWKVRGGKIGLRMIFVLFPILISIGLKKARETTNAILNRRS